LDTLAVLMTGNADLRAVGTLFRETAGCLRIRGNVTFRPRFVFDGGRSSHVQAPHVPQDHQVQRLEGL